MKKFETVDEYVAALPKAAKERLEELRTAIRRAAPHSEEAISYNMPAFKANGSLLVWYAAFKKHVGFYPKASGIAAFKKELSAYKTLKGAIQFPLERPIPVGLVQKIVKFRARENSAKS
jgi:uncharacterized protein YdhG (YjbR/CyaY superfamily)